MVENDNCLIWTQGPYIPCRGLKDKHNVYFPDSKGRCPFSKCVAAMVLSNPELIKRIFDPNSVDMRDKIRRSIVFHAICPGSFNPHADENIIYQYSPSKPFYPNCMERIKD